MRQSAYGQVGSVMSKMSAFLLTSKIEYHWVVGSACLGTLAMLAILLRGLLLLAFLVPVTKDGCGAVPVNGLGVIKIGLEEDRFSNG